MNVDDTQEEEKRASYMSVDSNYTRANHIYTEGLQIYTNPERLRLAFASTSEVNYPIEILDFLNTVPGVRTNTNPPFRKEDPELYFRIVRAIKPNSVYIAEDLASNTKRILKKVYCYSSRGNSVAESEATLALSMDHPNIVRTIETYKYNKTIWLVEELMDLCVNDLLNSVERLEETTIAWILKEVCKGLVYLHCRGIMHRDIKSENILLNLDGNVKVADFSYSAELHNETRETFVGSPGWLAPEMVGGKHDFKVDVWSLGILGIELAETTPPYSDQRPVFTVFSVISGPVPSLTNPSSWSEGFQSFLSQCLQKRPKLRPSVKELLQHPFLSEAGPQSLVESLSQLVETGVTN
mmetsp:Transcript_18616/g.33642  ORF Transcript_18616/g.33642 Transcript_18616/m.33642 type:complete len:353 (+) Transcript_18616:285-1343(+)|eukprot:CAMPEP_0204906950 /NCGR_PEP_ID=MMETSP1397-20131031/6238_1 /ASSEMBLY_ACC=CAM_ASM_000891 /TAXON_ID=49980 /ORGANISM="Climacostomum Climacostomum virens, Strain Stock W-24" /LENGTH=352 /DNA_ID=CAMNT_0052075957 /DNA_START=212 /DNA_END=1270 /DNA_ORIENTATION=-